MRFRLFRLAIVTCTLLPATLLSAQNAEVTPETMPEPTAHPLVSAAISQQVTLDNILAVFPDTAAPAQAVDLQPPTLIPEVLNRYPHDPTAFTQGLEFSEDETVLYESAGEYGASDVRQVDPTSGQVSRLSEIAPEIFSEGLTRVGDSLIQLSWREGAALVWDAETLALEGAFRYNQEGWGLCNDGEHLWHSDGSALLTRRDPETFSITGAILVTRAGLPVSRLNELECANGVIYANVWQTNEIMVIAPQTGQVEMVIDATALYDEVQGQLNDTGAVLNGIAYRASTNTFFLTGKLWPTMYEVRLEGVQR